MGAGVCAMHMLGSPGSMQDDPRYDDVVLQVFDYLAARIEAAEAAGIERSRIAADPGLGFGKTLAHNLALLAHTSLFHGLGVPLLVGASRKRFIQGVSGVAGDVLEAGGLRLKVEQVLGRRIRKVHAARLEPPEMEAERDADHGSA
jgi:dihydropteroate synthase